MTLQLRTLPIVERWDCHSCTACCRETTIELNGDDLARLRDQHWERDPEFAAVRKVKRSAFLLGPKVLAHKADGSCVFLTAAGLCRIHELHGADAKPLMCRQFPLQIVTTDCGAVATVVRSCPSAAADQGRPLEEQLSFLRRLLGDKLADGEPPAAPAIVRGIDRGWDDFHLLADALCRLVVDARFPLVRRIIHGLRYCDLVDECNWKRISVKTLPDLVEVFERAAPENVGPLFQERRPPTPAAARLFRRLGAHFIRCVPGGRPTRSWLDHWRVFRLSGQFARAKGQLPELHPRFPSRPVDELEHPLGPLPDVVLQPLNRFFESQAASQRFALIPARDSLVDSYRRLAFTFPMALWLLRYLAAGREPTADDMIQIVVALERGYVLPALTPAARYLADAGELERLTAWYSR